jgi:uncharacterized membrane protein
MANTFHTDFALSKNRLEALADGIFAIAMTLLVLEIKIPDLAKSVPASELGSALAHETPVFIGFFITFFLASFFWFFHHATFRHFHTLRPAVAVVNLAFLMFVSLLPFSTGLLSRFLQNSAAQAFYFGNQLALAILLAVHWTMVRKQTQEPASADERDQVQTLNRIYFFPPAYALALVVSLVAPQWSFVSLMFGFLIGRVTHRKFA